MSTEERYTHVLGKCPCGEGTVSEYVVSPDNAYSRIHRSVSIGCAKCSVEWDLVGRTMTLKSSRADTSRIHAEVNQTDREIERIGDEVLVGYFMRRGITTIKGEWEEMKRLGYYSKSLGTFQKNRGKLPDAVYQKLGMPLPTDWFNAEAGRTNAAQRLKELDAIKAERTTALRAANSTLVTRSLDQLERAEGETIFEE